MEHDWRQVQQSRDLGSLVVPCDPRWDTSSGLLRGENGSCRSFRSCRREFLLRYGQNRPQRFSTNARRASPGGVSGSFSDPQLEAIFKDAVSESRRLELLLIILPNDSSQLYNHIKTLGEIKYGLRTQCLLFTNFVRKGSPAYYANVALKINLKIGGSNHTVAEKDLSFIKDNKTMVVGIDMTHPSPGSSKTAPSVSGMVASIDKNLGQWPGTSRVPDKARSEMVSAIKDMLKSRLAHGRS